MHERSNNLIKNLLTNRMRDLLDHASKLNPAPSGLVSEIETTSAALCDFIRGEQGVNPAVAAVSETVVRGRDHLIALHEILDSGTGKGSAAHKFVGRLIGLITPPAGAPQDQPPAPHV